MARFAISMKDSVTPFAAARYGLPPLPPAELVRELSATVDDHDEDGLDEASGPGWYQSSRELRRGLEVRDAPYDDWLCASSFGGITPLQAAA